MIPICQGTNSLSPKPSSSLLLAWPEAVRSISWKILSPMASIDIAGAIH